MLGSDSGPLPRGPSGEAIQRGAVEGRRANPVVVRIRRAQPCRPRSVGQQLRQRPHLLSDRTKTSTGQIYGVQSVAFPYRRIFKPVAEGAVKKIFRGSFGACPPPMEICQEETTSSKKGLEETKFEPCFSTRVQTIFHCRAV